MLDALRRKITRVPSPTATPVYALWGRGGATADVRGAGARGFDVAGVLDS